MRFEGPYGKDVQDAGSSRRVAVAAAVRRGLALLGADDPPPLDAPPGLVAADYKGLLEFAVKQRTMWTGTGIAHRPWFYRRADGSLDSPQRQAIGLHLAQACCRGALIGAQGVAAGDALLAKRFLAAASALYYTGAYHAVAGLLGAHGRVLVVDVHGPPLMVREGTGTWYGHAQLEPHPKVVCAILRRRGGWSFEPRHRSHVARWNEIRQCLGVHDPLPTYLLRALRYLLEDWSERLDPATLLERGLPRLASVRHQALYEGFGYDDESFDQQVNREGMGDLTVRCRELRRLGIALIGECISATAPLLRHAPAGSHAAASARLGVILPAFEFGPTVPLADNPHVGEGVAACARWLGFPGG